MRRALLMVIRALELRCPNCGSRGLLRSWLRVEPVCPGCGLRVERESGHFLGSMAINLVVTEVLWAAAFAWALVATWPRPPVDLLTWGSIGLMVLFPLVFFPFSKTLWLALDLLFRPLQSRDAEQEPRLRR